MLNVSRILIDGAIVSAIASLYLLAVLNLNPRLFLQDYPQDIQRAVPQKTKKEKWLSIVLGIPFLLFLFLGSFISTLNIEFYSDGEISFFAAFIQAFGVVFIFNLVDWLILDWLIFCTITPKFLVIPDTEGMAGYKDYSFHFRAFLVGIAFSIIAGLVIGALVVIT
jgi:hypothetical protein